MFVVIRVLQRLTRFPTGGTLSACGRERFAHGRVLFENLIHFNLCQVSRHPRCCQHKVPQEPDLVGERLVVELSVGVWLHGGPPVLWAWVARILLTECLPPRC